MHALNLFRKMQKVGAGDTAVMGQNRGMTSKSVPKVVPMFQIGTRTTKQRRGFVLVR
jgi:hypothetical protein